MKDSINIQPAVGPRIQPLASILKSEFIHYILFTKFIFFYSLQKFLRELYLETHDLLKIPLHQKSNNLLLSLVDSCQTCGFVVLFKVVLNKPFLKPTADRHLSQSKQRVTFILFSETFPRCHSATCSTSCSLKQFF